VAEPTGPDAIQEKAYHTYKSAAIPWVVRLLWVGFWIGLVIYVIRWAIPSAKNYF
jgi:hypothetical protein